jgi:DNA mismatch endonuclease (patch repair protein)
MQCLRSWRQQLHLAWKQCSVLAGNVADRFSKARRSALMSRIKGRDTVPEMVVRKLVHRLGYRFHLHSRDLPGRPDIVLPRHRKVILVHGCFWHGHKGCRRSKRPSTNRAFWNRKINGNILRDWRTVEGLKRAGWDFMVVWQCQTKDAKMLCRRVKKFLTHK